MGYIKILDESVSNIIAAGEVVENPASMIKEMIENSLDAKSTLIKIEVFKGGLEVKITDNGIGMDKEDTLLSIERHATSKIVTKEDVFNLRTYGFRGEALASIAAVSKLTITTRSEKSSIGYKISSYAGVVRQFEEISKNIGTEIDVRDLFYNTPARKKFLRKESTEYNKIRDIVLKEALANSNVAFTLEFDNKSSIITSGKGIENTILELFGKSIFRNLKKFKYGYLGNVEILRSTKDYIFTYVNSRYVKSNTIERAIIDGYYTKLMKGKYPFAIIFYNINPQDTDVNVHPSKKIIKFSNDKLVYKEIKNEIDEFFYYNDREEWQPNIDLLKKTINIENKEEKINNLFIDEVLKDEKQQFFSFETNTVTQDDNKFENVEKNEYIINENDSNFTDTNKKDNLSERDYKNYNYINDSKYENIINKFKDINIKKNTNNNNSEIQLNEKNEVSEFIIGTFEKKVGKQIEYDVLGQLFNTYILVKNEDKLEIYDQHIIHERILYEELKEKFYNKKLEVKQLLIPQKLEVNQIEKNIIFENISILNELGFDIDEFSESEIVIRAVPAFDFRENIQDVLKNLVYNIQNDVEIKDIRENIIISMSCKGAVKAGQKLDMYEMQNMVRRLHEVGKYTCPHGRPIIVNLTKNDLDKMFGRKK